MINRVLVTGSRTWTDRRSIVERLLAEPDNTLIIHGDAHGADTIAHQAAVALGFAVRPVPVTAAEWKLHGKAAGMMRNRRMLDMLPDKVIAFLKDNSRGTTGTIKAARRRGLSVEVIEERKGVWKTHEY